LDLVVPGLVLVVLGSDFVALDLVFIVLALVFVVRPGQGLSAIRTLAEQLSLDQ
jgi:hypothetical protein